MFLKPSSFAAANSSSTSIFCRSLQITSEIGISMVCLQMIAQENLGLTVPLPPRFLFRNHPSPEFDSSNTLSLSVSIISELFGASRKLKSFVFNKIQTLCAKHRGWGYARPPAVSVISNLRLFLDLCFHIVTKP